MYSYPIKEIALLSTSFVRQLLSLFWSFTATFKHVSVTLISITSKLLLLTSSPPPAIEIFEFSSMLFLFAYLLFFSLPPQSIHSNFTTSYFLKGTYFPSLQQFSCANWTYTYLFLSHLTLTEFNIVGHFLLFEHFLLFSMTPMLLVFFTPSGTFFLSPTFPLHFLWSSLKTCGFSPAVFPSPFCLLTLYAWITKEGQLNPS